MVFFYVSFNRLEIYLVFLFIALAFEKENLENYMRILLTRKKIELFFMKYIQVNWIYGQVECLFEYLLDMGNAGKLLCCNCHLSKKFLLFWIHFCTKRKFQFVWLQLEIWRSPFRITVITKLDLRREFAIACLILCYTAEMCLLRMEGTRTCVWPFLHASTVSPDCIHLRLNTNNIVLRWLNLWILIWM